jgi:polyphosphate kinase
VARRARKQALLKPAPVVSDPAHAQLFINRELSWLAFNERVLEEARDRNVPLAERLKFLAIVASNLDEFFMVRVAGLKQQLSGNVAETPPDGLTAAEQLAAISTRTHAMITEQYRIWRDDIEPGLDAARVRFLRPDELTPPQKQHLSSYFAHEVWPVLTPLAVDPGHPFPMLRNRSLNLAVFMQREKEKDKVARRETMVAVVQVPSVLPRMTEVPTADGNGAPAGASAAGAGFSFMLLEDLIAMHAGELFPGYRVLNCSAFRVTRNFDLSIDEDEADDLLKTIQKELRRRERGSAVRMEIEHDTPTEVVGFLRSALRLENDDVYLFDGPLHLADLMPISGRDELRDHRDEPFSPQIVPPLQEYEDIFRVIAQRDILLQHPYESFEDVVEFISEAADDPNVLAIKQTLYRTSADSPIVRALIRAAENGKQVTAVVELKARFDEAPNIQWARTLEDAGVHVVYGLIALKTHCKVALVVRREGNRIKRYVHLSTGNYNPSTARIYGDLSYFTAREAYADDAGALFNLLTGYSSPPSWQRFSIAPLGLQERIIALIEREAALGARGRIIAKMNSLVDAPVIKALYRASQAGVQIDLIVRGICCLRPGVPGTSENIRVISIVDRFLEHARIFHFENGGKREVYLSSADWMPRNFQRRVEVMFPIEDEGLRDRVVDEILGIALADNVKARKLLADGSYVRVRPTDASSGAPAIGAAVKLVRSQYRFMELAREKAQSGSLPGASGPYHVRTTPPARPSASTGTGPPTPAPPTPAAPDDVPPS